MSENNNLLGLQQLQQTFGLALLIAGCVSGHLWVNVDLCNNHIYFKQYLN